MRKTLAVLLAASCASSYAQDIYPEWPISGDDEFRTELLEPDFESGGIFYHIIPGADNEVAVMNNHSLLIRHKAEEVLFCEALEWTVDAPYEGDVAVPPSVVHEGKAYEVTTVMYGAFANSADLKSVSLPESVKEIRGGIFAGCSSLDGVQLPGGLSQLPSWTYAGCKSLKSIDLRPYASVGAASLAGCYGLLEVVCTGSPAQVEALRGRYDTRDAMGVAPDMSGSLRRVYVTDPEAAAMTGYGQGSFADSEYAEATLYVPAGSGEAFAASDFWGRFSRIEEREYSGLHECFVETNISVVASNGTISVRGLDGKAQIYDITGRCGATLLPACPQAKALTTGLYIVRTPAGTWKVRV